MVPTAAIDRISPNDAQNLAADRGPAPWNIAALLVLEGGEPFDLAAARVEVERRLLRVPRLRQRLWRVPVGLGRPVWVDHGPFDIASHVAQISCPAPGDGRTLLDVVADIVTRRLPKDRPLWSLTFITGLEGRRTGALVVLHHVLADGLGGLAVLAALVDEAARPSHAPPFPRPAPTRAALWKDARRSNLATLRRLPAALPLVVRAVSALRAVPHARAARTSLNRPTGRSRRLFVARAELQAVKDVAHQHGATVNDVVLTAVGGALAEILQRRGERPGALVASVPVASRPSTDASHLGNNVGVMPVDLCVREADAGARLAAISRLTRIGRAADAAATATVLDAIARAMGALGLTRRFTEHQHMVNTFVTNVRGPADRLTMLGRRIVDVIPVPPTIGNIPVSFGVLSYAGTLVITVITDPQAAPDGEAVAAALSGQLQGLVAADGAIPPG